MTRRTLTLLGFAALAVATVRMPAAVAAPAKPAAGSFLADTVVICRVGDRVTRVKDFVRLYFDSYIEDRPSSDSLGRVTFLNNIVAKDVLGQLALKRNAPFGFEQRVQMREHEQRVLSNALYQNAVAESLEITEEQIAREYDLFKWEVRLRHMRFTDFETANRIRNQLLRGAISWHNAYEKYSLSKATDKEPDGLLGWTVRGGSDLELARQIFTLGVNGITEPIEEPDGWTLIQVADRRRGNPPALSAVSEFIKNQLVGEQVGTRTEAVRTVIRNQIHMVYDSSAIAFAARQFHPARNFTRDETGSGKMELDLFVPDFSPQDTARVLARYRDGVYTLGRFMHQFTDIQPLLRPTVHTYEAFRGQLDAFAFEPYMADVARERGLERDSSVVAQIAKKREQLLVERLYSDSVLARISYDPKARRDYYQANLPQFFTYARVKFASMWAENRAEADSFATLLRNGEKAEDILAAQKLLGIDRGSVRERTANDHGDYQKVLFEEMRPGQVNVEGPDKVGHYLVLQKIEHDPGRQLSYEESAGYIDETMQNVQAERLLKELVARHAREYHIVTHPEWVMKINLVDPTL